MPPKVASARKRLAAENVCKRGRNGERPWKTTANRCRAQLRAVTALRTRPNPGQVIAKKRGRPWPRLPLRNARSSLRSCRKVCRDCCWVFFANSNPYLYAFPSRCLGEDPCDQIGGGNLQISRRAPRPCRERN